MGLMNVIGSVLVVVCVECVRDCENPQAASWLDVKGQRLILILIFLLRGGTKLKKQDMNMRETG